MPLLARKGILAIAAVIEIAVHARSRPITAKVLAARYGLASRHLEPVLQAMVRDGILKGIRGPRGGYELARERSRISVEQILRAAGTTEDTGDTSLARPQLLDKVVMPALGEAERAFSVALARISVEDLTRSAQSLRKGAEHEAMHEQKPWRDAS
jgi:Rrf2 family transcriptional regulator, iron-sulfur cluster assembly transcription factor